MKFTLSLVLTIFLMGSLSICLANTANNSNPKEQAKKLASFKTQMLSFQLIVKKGDLVTSKTRLSEIITLAEAEFSQYAERKNWIEANACDQVDIERINYFIKGRETKQKELISSLKSYISKKNATVEDYNNAKKYVRYFYDSMVESQSEAQDVYDNCK